LTESVLVPLPPPPVFAQRSKFLRTTVFAQFFPPIDAPSIWHFLGPRSLAELSICEVFSPPISTARPNLSPLSKCRVTAPKFPQSPPPSSFCVGESTSGGICGDVSCFLSFFSYSRYCAPLYPVRVDRTRDFSPVALPDGRIQQKLRDLKFFRLEPPFLPPSGVLFEPSFSLSPYAL